MLVPDRYLKILLVLILMGCIPSEVFAIDLNGSWTYRENGGSNVETFRETRQNYSFGVGPSLSYKPSHALSANASVGYTQVNTVDESSSSTSRVVTPTAGFVLINDLFTARISGSSVNSQSGGGDWTADSNWNSTLSSGWSEPYIPSLQLSYGESGDSTQSSAISSLETQRRDFGAGIDWDLNLAEFTYRYRDSSSEALSNTQSQFFKVVTAGRFLDNRLSFSLSQQAQFETFEISSGLVGGTVDVPVGQTTRYAVSSTDTPVDYNCNVTSTAGVDCLTSASFPITYTASSYVQIAVSPLDNRSIGVVEIAFNTDFNTADSSVWDLYEYRSASDSWELTSSNLPIVQSTLEVVGVTTKRWHRIEIPETSQEFMLVSDLRGAEGRITDVEVFEVFPLLPGGSGRSTKRYLTNAVVQMTFTDDFSTSLALTYDRDESETDSGTTSDVTIDKLTTSANIRWVPLNFLTASLGASEFREIRLGEELQINRNYSLTLSSDPLPTLKVSFGVLLNERFGVVLEDRSTDIDQKTLETIRYIISGKAQIYPDLSASFNLNYSQGKRWLKDEGADTGRFADDAGFNGRVDLNAILFEGFTADVITRYGQSENDGSKRDSGSLEFGLRYRLSELLLMRGEYRTDFGDSERVDSISLRSLVRLLNTDKSRLEAELRHTQAEEAAEVFSLNGSWLMNKNMTILGRGAYVIGETNNYNLRFDLRIGI